MKRLVFAWLLIALPSCAFGKIDDAINEIETTLNDLHTAECIRTCTDVAELCLDEANDVCIDACEVEEEACDNAEAECFDYEQLSCTNLTGPAYTTCIETARETCDQDCNKQSSDCNQVCGDDAQECLTTDAYCVADCVQELEDSLKGITF